VNSTLLICVMFFGMILLLLTGRQIFIVIGATGTILALFLWGEGAYFIPFSKGTTFLDFYSLLAIPPFIFMGLMLSKSGVAEKIFYAAYIWVGRLPGGLGIVSVILSALIAAMSGTNVAATVTAGTISLPAMLKHNYNKRFSVGICMAGGALGFLIPPSVVFIFYGVIAKVSIAFLWLAGIGPGILLVVLYIIYIYFLSKKHPEIAPPISIEEFQKITFKDRMVALGAALPPLILIVTILNFLFMGVTTLVETSAIGAVGAIICAKINKRLNWNVIKKTMEVCLQTTTMIMWIISAAFVFSAVFDGLGAIDGVEKMLFGFGGGKWTILIVMEITFLFLGMILDDTAMLIIVAPLYIPLVAKLGFDLRWFGVLYVLSCQMAFITPPFGYNLFIMKGIAPEGVTMEDIYLSVIPFVGIQIIALCLVMLFPQIAMFLPNLKYGG